MNFFSKTCRHGPGEFQTGVWAATGHTLKLQVLKCNSHEKVQDFSEFCYLLEGEVILTHLGKIVAILTNR